MSESDVPILDAQLELDSASVDSGGQLRYAVVNTGTVRILLGETYELERRTGNRWERLRLSYRFHMIGYRLRTGERHELTAHLPPDAKPGRYRLRKELQADPYPRTREGHQANDLPPSEVTAEFDVTEA